MNMTLLRKEAKQAQIDGDRLLRIAAALQRVIVLNGEPKTKTHGYVEGEHKRSRATRLKMAQVQKKRWAKARRK